MPAPRPLYLYKFHSKACVVHTLDLKPSAKKYYKPCDCAIWITGINAKGEFVPRMATGLRDWSAAEAYLAKENERVAAEIRHGENGVTLEEATTKFVDSHKSEGNVGKGAERQYRLVMNRFTRYAKKQGVTFAADLTYSMCKDFMTYGFEDVKEDSTRSTYRAKLKKFLGEAFSRKWIKEDIAEKIKNEKPPVEPGEPYTPEEVKLILEQAEKLNGGTTGYARNGRAFRLLLELMLETGLRVSDAIRYNPAHAFKGKTGLWKYVYEPKKQPRKRQKKTALTFLSERLKLAIDQCEWFSKALPFAYDVVTKNDDKHERAVYERMQAIGQRCILEEEKRDAKGNVIRPQLVIDDCRPHRLRDTFAVNKLEKGMALDDVSVLLGL
jgi:site-specific recombinase XerD